MNAALMDAAINLLQDQQNPEDQYSTRCNAECTPVVVTTTDDSADAQQADANNNNEDAPATANSTQRTPTVSTPETHAVHATLPSGSPSQNLTSTRVDTGRLQVIQYNQTTHHTTNTGESQCAKNVC